MVSGHGSHGLPPTIPRTLSTGSLPGQHRPAHSSTQRRCVYTLHILFEWCQSGGRRKYKQKGKLGQIHTHTHAQEELCVNPQGTECYIHTERERENIGSSTVHNDAFDFLSFWSSKDGRNRGRGVIVESRIYQVSLLRERKQQQQKKRPAQINSSLSLCEPRTSYIERDFQTILAGRLHCTSKSNLGWSFFFLSLCVGGCIRNNRHFVCQFWFDLFWFIYRIIQARTKLGKLFDLRAVLHCWSLSIRNRAITKASSFCDVSNSSSIQLKCLIWWTEDPVLGEKRFLFLRRLSLLPVFSFFISIRPHSCLFVCVLLTDWGYSGTLIHSGSWFAAATDLLVGSFPKSTSSIWMWVLFLSFFFPSPCLMAPKSDDWAAHTQHTHTHNNMDSFFYCCAEAMPDWSPATGHWQWFGTSHRLG